MGLAIDGGENMKACPEYEETLYLDVLGELSPDREIEWKKHLQNCVACRQRRADLARVMKTARENGRAPELEPSEIANIRAGITEALSSKNDNIWVTFFKRRWKTLVPAMAAVAGLFLISLVSLNTWWPRKHTPQMHKENIAVKQSAEGTDPELIQDMELLEQIDTLRMLVKVVDNKDII